MVMTAKIYWALIMYLGYVLGALLSQLKEVNLPKIISSVISRSRCGEPDSKAHALPITQQHL